MGYKHLTREQRYTIEALLQTPMSLREIGEVIGVSTGPVSHWVTGHRWNIANNYLILTFEVCCTSKLNSPQT